MSIGQVKRPARRPRLHVWALALLFGMLLVPASAFAHAELQSTDPAPGTRMDPASPEVTLTFSEPVEPVDGGFVLHAPDGIVADDLDASADGSDIVVTLPGDLAAQSYILEWRVASADGHPINDSLTFSVGETTSNDDTPFTIAHSDADVQPWMSIVQAIGYVSMLFAVGTVWFQVFISRRIEDTILSWAMLATIISTIAHILMIPLHRANQRGEGISAIFDAEMWKVGAIHPTVRAVSFIAIGLGLQLIFARRVNGGKLARWGVFLGGLVALGSMTIVGHTSEIGPTWTMHGADFVHGVVAAFWVGGIIGLARYLVQVLRSPVDGTPPVEATVVVARFSWLAGWSVVALAISGLVMSSRILGSFDALRETEYGKLLIAKLAIVAIVVLIAAFNRFRLIPAIDGAPTSHAAWRRLRTAILTEGTLLLAIVIVTSFLVFANPTA